MSSRVRMRASSWETARACDGSRSTLVATTTTRQSLSASWRRVLNRALQKKGDKISNCKILAVLKKKIINIKMIRSLLKKFLKLRKQMSSHNSLIYENESRMTTDGHINLIMYCGLLVDQLLFILGVCDNVLTIQLSVFHYCVIIKIII